MNPQFTYEQEHLKGTLAKLEKSFKLLNTETKDLFKKYREGIKKAARSGDRQDNVVEEMAALNQMMELKGFRYKEAMAERLESQKQKPYFARINFTPSDTKEELDIYIGKHSFGTEDKYRVYDWRAPISSLYYNYPGPEDDVSYEFDVHNPRNLSEVMHKKIEGDLSLRRILDIEYDKEKGKPELIAVYDNSARVDLMNKEIGKKTGGVLQDIVQTIQQTQNKIIRSPKHIVAIIQGTAGSGKTTVAIHRISFLLYSHPELKEHEVLLLSASKVLANYIEKTLPELEIYALTRDTLEDYLLKKLNEKEVLGPKVTITNKKDTDPITKNSDEFLIKLDEFISEKNQYFKDFVTEISEYKKLNLQRFFERGEKRPVVTNINRMLESLKEQLDEIKKERKKGNITVEKKMDSMDEAIIDLEFIKDEFNVEKLYQEFLRTHYPKLQGNDYSLLDVVVLFYLANGLLQVVEDHEKFRQIVVDEGQELGKIHYRIIKDLGYKAGYTILGDLNQATEDNGSIKDWGDVEEVFNSKTPLRHSGASKGEATEAKKEFEYFNIKTSYRNTKQITAYAKNILQKFKEFKYLPVAFERDGDAPVVQAFKNKNEILDEIVTKVENIRKTGNNSAIAIIEPDQDQISKTYKYLKSKKLKFELITEDFTNFTSTGVYLVDQELVKGLEFDTVFIVNPNEKLFPATPLSAKRLFVLCTRAINNLFVYHTGNLSEIVK